MNEINPAVVHGTQPPPKQKSKAPVYTATAPVCSATYVKEHLKTRRRRTAFCAQSADAARIRSTLNCCRQVRSSPLLPIAGLAPLPFAGFFVLSKADRLRVARACRRAHIRIRPPRFGLG